jgi:toxin-antitoxin system PIN domain toxin
MTYLADVNVWFALVYVAHVHYSIATAWFEAVAADQTAMCRITQSGLLRLLTNPKAMGPDVLTAAEAWTTYDKLRSDVRVTFAAEPSGLEIAWRAMTRQPHAGPNFWTDAYLSAFAQAGDYTVVTFDRGFTRHRRTRVRLLEPSV